MQTAPLVLFFKAHVDTYTRGDGTLVEAHDDNRPSAQAQPEKPKRQQKPKKTPELVAHERAEKKTIEKHGTTAGRWAEDTYKKYYLAYLELERGKKD